MFKDISYLELWWPFHSAKQKHLCNLSGGHYEEQFFEIIILNSDQWFSKCLLKIFHFIDLLWSFCSAEWNDLCNFGREHHEVHFCEIILNWTSGSRDVY